VGQNSIKKNKQVLEYKVSTYDTIPSVCFMHEKSGNIKPEEIYPRFIGNKNAN